jgi:hypothetical protein
MTPPAADRRALSLSALSRASLLSHAWAKCGALRVTRLITVRLVVLAPASDSVI